MLMRGLALADWRSRLGSLLGLGSIPQLVELLEVEVAQGDAALGAPPLDAAEPAPELVVGGPQRGLRLDAAACGRR